jgi:hypothetical protein
MFERPQALTARFLSVDPVLQIARAQRMPQLWNRYSYALGGPLKYTDPSGALIGSKGSESCEGWFCSIHQWFERVMQSAFPPPRRIRQLEAQGYTDPDVTATSAINPVQQAGQVQGAPMTSPRRAALRSPQPRSLSGATLPADPSRLSWKKVMA